MSIGKLLLKYLGGKVAFQKLFEKIYNIGIMGMGYGELMSSNAPEKWAINYVLGKIPSNSKIFDVGANTGEYTKEIQVINENFKKEILYYSFEPNPKIFSVLQEKYKSNSSVIATNVALSNEANRDLKFYCYNNDVLSSFYKPDYSRGNNIYSEIIIKTETLENFCLLNKINEIDFLKVDTEGHDYFILLGSKTMIDNKQIKFIQFEFSDMNIISKTTFKDFWDLLSENYIIYRECKDGLYELKSYNTLNCEIYYPNNFLAEAKK